MIFKFSYHIEVACAFMAIFSYRYLVLAFFWGSGDICDKMDEKFPRQIPTEIAGIFFLIESALSVVSIPVVHLANPFVVPMI